MATEANCVAVDWGTTNLRAFLLDPQGRVLAQRHSPQGALQIDSGKHQQVLYTLIGDWLTPTLPVLMAGMVGSRGGWHEVPYCNCPVALDELQDHLYWLDTDLPGPVAIVPGLQAQGVSGSVDVMRGEETQLLGVLDWLEQQGQGAQNLLCCLPGTHCKWVPLQHGSIHCFSTTFSGEVFAQLNQDSSLVRGLPMSAELNQQAFLRGVGTCRTPGGLLHHLFSCRSNFVSGQLPADQVRDYLSGVVIGHDVFSMLTALDNQQPVLLVGSEALCQRYALALETFAIGSEFLSAAEASVRGLQRLACQSTGRRKQ